MKRAITGLAVAIGRLLYSSMVQTFVFDIAQKNQPEAFVSNSEPAMKQLPWSSNVAAGHMVGY
jgi:hypothetical protein